MALKAQYLFAGDAVDAVAGHNGSIGGDASFDVCSLTVTGHSGSTFTSSTHADLLPNAAHGSMMAWMSWPSALSALWRDSPNGNGWMLVGRKSGDSLLNEIIYRVGGTEVHTGLALTFLSDRLTHYALTWDATDSKLFINGALVFTGPAPGGSAGTLPWRYGKNGFFSNYWPGRIADWRLYDNRPSDAAVTAIAAAGSPCDTPETDFEGSPTSGDAPLSVQFIDLSSGTITGWAWDFGDGDTSTDQSPLHVYTTPGIYTVSLTTTSGLGDDTETKTDYIEVFQASTPGVYIDWAADGFHTDDDDNVTANVRSWDISRGAAAELTGSSQPGSCTLILKNPDDLYNPSNAAGPLYGLLRDGPAVWIGVNDQGGVSGGTGVNGLFAGRITDITPIPAGGAYDSPMVEIICEDPLGWYGRTSVRVSEARDRSQAELRLAALVAAGEARYDLPDEPRGLPLSSYDGMLAGILEALNAASGTRHFAKPHDNLSAFYTYVARGRMYKVGAGSDGSLDGSADHVDTSGWRTTAATVINQQRVSVTPVTFPDFRSTVWEAENLPITGDTSLELWANFDDFVADAEIEISSSTGSTAALTAFGRTAKITITDAGAIRVERLVITGRKVERGLEQGVVVDDLASQAPPRGIRAGADISGDLIGSHAAGFGLATHIVWRFASPQLRPSVSVQNWIPEQFQLDLLDLLDLTSGQLKEDARLFEIVGLQHHCDFASPEGVLHKTDYVVAESRVQTPTTWFTWDTSVWDGDDNWSYF